ANECERHAGVPRGTPHIVRRSNEWRTGRSRWRGGGRRKRRLHRLTGRYRTERRDGATDSPCGVRRRELADRRQMVKPSTRQGARMAAWAAGRISNGRVRDPRNGRESASGSTETSEEITPSEPV